LKIKIAGVKKDQRWFWKRSLSKVQNSKTVLKVVATKKAKTTNRTDRAADEGGRGQGQSKGGWQMSQNQTNNKTGPTENHKL
jgi:hypothetical protein